VPRPILVSGLLGRKTEADLAFKVPGIVVAVPVDVGSKVKKGQLLALVDPTELRAGLAQADASSRKADRDLERTRGLRGTGVVADVELQNAETYAESAKAARSAAEFNVGHSALLAPEDGVIDRKSVSVGEIAQPGRPVFRLSGSSRGVVLRAQVPDRQALQIGVGTRAYVVLDADGVPQEPARMAAHVARIASMATPGLGTLEVELLIDDPRAASLPSGITAKGYIDHEERPEGVVPPSAITSGRGLEANVFVVEGDRARVKRVQIGAISSDGIAIVSGLGNAASVVVRGAEDLSDGALVRVTP
jgi:RND family efflux transporter MFP subunit